MDRKAWLGARIRALRKSQRWSQGKLSERAGLSTQYLSNIERGKENPTLDLLLRLADALRVSLAEMCNYETEGMDRGRLQSAIRELLETEDVERLRTALRILRGVLR